MKAGESQFFDASGRPDSAARATQRRAGEWLAQREAHGFSDVDQADFDRWCAADPRHAAVFAEVESAWRTFDKLSAYPHRPDSSADPNLLARPKPFRRLVAPALLAAAAGIAVAAAAWFKPWSSPSATAAPAAVADAGLRFKRLADGSEVALNARSEVVEHFTRGERRVVLVRGEAQFTVAKNPMRPFIVEANGVAVRAVGTVFDVSMGATTVEVLVTEGKVQVNRPPASGKRASAPDGDQGATAPILVAGQRVVIPTDARAGLGAFRPVVETLARPDIDRRLAWQTSRLEFDATPLSEVVIRLNRHSADQPGVPHFTIEDAELGAMRISGRIRSDNIENFVQVLEANFGVVAERRADGEILLRKAR